MLSRAPLQAIKKYIHGNFKVAANADTQINIALKRGVDKGDFVQPKGASGPVKLVRGRARRGPS